MGIGSQGKLNRPNTFVSENPKDPRLRDYQDLRDPTLRRRYESNHGVFVAEGLTVVERLLRSDYSIRSVLTTPRGARLLSTALAETVCPVFEVSDDVAEELTGYRVHRGILACAERHPPRDAVSLLGTSGRIIVLEDLTDQTNIGAIFRNGLALGADAVLLSPSCCDPLYRRSIRVSMGASLFLPFAYLEPWPTQLAKVSSDRPLVALTPDPEAPSLDQVINELRGAPVALMLGTEGGGLSGPALAACQIRARIPMRPGSDSLNVATAAAVALARMGLP